MTVLNRIVSIDHPTIRERDDFGSQVIIWKTFATVWAEKRPQAGTTRFEQGSAREQSLRRAIFRIYLRQDVYEVYRIIDDAGLIWDIEGVNHLDDRWTELTCAADVSAPPGDRGAELEELGPLVMPP